MSWLARFSFLGRTAAEPPPPSGSGMVWLFGGEVSGGTPTAVVEKYDLNTGARTTPAALGGGDDGRGFAAAGDTTRAILHGSADSITTTRKYTYSSSVTTTSGTMVSTGYSRSAANSATKGYWFGGGTIPYSVGVDIIPFATDVRQGGTNLSAGRGFEASCGDANQAIVAGGQNDAGTVLATTEKYHYSDDVRTSGTALGTARLDLGAIANLTRGIYVGGNSGGGPLASVERYNFTSAVRDGGTALGVARTNPASGGNNALGLIAGGDLAIAYTLTTVIYDHSAGTWSAGNNLTATAGRTNGAGACDTPGGL